MKLTKRKLKQLIKEELRKELNEAVDPAAVIDQIVVQLNNLKTVLRGAAGGGAPPGDIVGRTLDELGVEPERKQDRIGRVLDELGVE